MPHSARPGHAQLRSRPGKPSRPALSPGIQELAETPLPAQPATAAAALLFVPPSVAPANPLLVYFHGAGGAAATSLPVVSSVAARHGCLVLLPTSTARTWDLIASGWGPDVARLDAALAVVLDHFAVTRLAFAGFSDGASYALSLGLANGELAQALLAFSPGFAAPPDRLGRPRIWITHGTEDTVLPIDRCARPVARALAKAGYELSYEEFVGPHEVRPDSVDQAVRWWLTEAD
ncbi:MAG: alpha/beta hydrolase [Jatrophihabitantaceae bacterium]